MFIRKKSLFEPRMRPFESPIMGPCGIIPPYILTRYELIERLRK